MEIADGCSCCPTLANYMINIVRDQGKQGLITPS